MQQQKGCIVISIDDGSVDHYRLYRLLKSYEVPATFNIITSRMEREGYLTKEQLREIYQDPLMEIACHGHTHKNTDEDILEANACLGEWLGATGNGIGFASPGSQMKLDFVMENEAHLSSLGLVYVRSADNPSPCARHRELAIQLPAKGAPETVLTNISRLIYSIDGMYLPSAVVYQHTPVEDLKALADLAIQEGACLIVMLHRVEKPGEPHWENTWCYDFDKTEQFLRHIKKREQEGAVELLTTREMFEKRYPEKSH